MLAHDIARQRPLTNQEIALQALADALGPAGMAEFVTRNYTGQGDYTKEKYDRPDPTMEEIIQFLNEHKND